MSKKSEYGEAPDLSPETFIEWAIKERGKSGKLYQKKVDGMVALLVKQGKIPETLYIKYCSGKLN